MSLAIVSEELIKTTTSRCPECLVSCPAEIWKQGHNPSKVYLKRTCQQHGERATLLSSDARFYWLSKGAGSCDSGCACSADTGEVKGALGKNALAQEKSAFEKLSTCIALIEIVDSCNLSCPVCFANSPFDGRHVKAPSLENIIQRIQGVIERKGHLEILQLSGGEPTLHPDFFALLDWIYANKNIDYVLINTNGIKLARDKEFLEKMREAVKRGDTQVYLQFDGTEEAGQASLRGTDLRKVKEQAIQNCAEIGLPITLAMTVTHENLPTIWQSISYGLKFPHIRGISFQPMFGSGRNTALAMKDRLNVADIIVTAVESSAGTLRYEDFTPLPCGDPNCATIGYLLKIGDKVHSISEFVDFSKIQGFLGDRVRYREEDLAKCGCESEPLGQLLKQFELDASHTFRIFIKPFMDAWTWDQDRIDRCCTHVIRPDGKLDSFCRYYSGFPG